MKRGVEEREQEAGEENKEREENRKNERVAGRKRSSKGKK